MFSDYDIIKWFSQCLSTIVFAKQTHTDIPSHSYIILIFSMFIQQNCFDFMLISNSLPNLIIYANVEE